MSARTDPLPAHSDYETARARIDRIADWAAVGLSDVIAAHQGRDWIALGYGSWVELCEAEFRGAMIGLPRGERQDAVAELTDAGMSTRAIGAALGVSDETARRDQQAVRATNVAPEQPTPVTGLDGKTYTRPEPREVVEVITVDAGTGEIIDARDRLDDACDLLDAAMDAAEAAPTVEEYVSADADYRAAVLRKELGQWINRFRPPAALPPAEAADLIGSDELKVALLRSARASFDAWCDEFERSLKPSARLRVVKGM